MFRIVWGTLLVAATGCADVLGLEDVTRDDGPIDPVRLAALEDQVAALQSALQPVAFRASLGATQNVGNRSPDIVEFSQVQLDTHHAFDAANHQYVIPAAGEYVVTATVGFDAINLGRGNCEIRLDPAGPPAEVKLTEVSIPANASGSGTDPVLRIPCTASVRASVGDRVFIRAFQDSGKVQPLEATPEETNFQVIRIPGVE